MHVEKVSTIQLQTKLLEAVADVHVSLEKIPKGSTGDIHRCRMLDPDGHQPAIEAISNVSWGL